MSKNSARVVVVGGSGFVGSAVLEAVRRRGAKGSAVPAPRLAAPAPIGAEDLETQHVEPVRALTEAFAGVDVVVNAAGNPDAGSRDQAGLYGANGVLPGVVGAAARAAGVDRYVHVSSAVVQGRAERLDESFAVDGFSAYARSKIIGERMALDLGPRETVVYRPPSVHAASRKVSRLTARIAGSALASVAAPGTQNSPQAHIANVGDIIAFLALTPDVPPPVVIHPSEGFTSESLMQTLGGRDPLVLPRPLATAVVRTAELVGRLAPALAANARRVEMLWFGQEQAPSWAVRHGWTPVAGIDEWRRLSHQLSTPTEGQV